MTWLFLLALVILAGCAWVIFGAAVMGGELEMDEGDWPQDSESNPTTASAPPAKPAMADGQTRHSEHRTFDWGCGSCWREWRALLVFLALLLVGCAPSFSSMRGHDERVQVETKLGPYRKVIRVVDGDTLHVQNYGTVRLLGVDTPELHHPNKPVERCAVEAAAFVDRLLDGENVRLSFAGRRIDRYGRTLAYVWRYGLVQERLLRAGLARSAPASWGAHPRKAAFDAMQFVAETEHRGIWSPTACLPVVGQVAGQ